MRHALLLWLVLVGLAQAATGPGGGTSGSTTSTNLGGNALVQVTNVVRAAQTNFLSAPTFLIFGVDSLTATGAINTWTYYVTNRLRRDPNFIGSTNAGVSGRQMHNYVTNEQNDVLRWSPRAGTNGIHAPWGYVNDIGNYAIEQLKTDFDNLCLYTHTAGMMMVAFTVPAITNGDATFTNYSDRLALNAYIRQSAGWDRLVDIDRMFPAASPDFQSDNVHFTTNGYRMIADEVIRQISSSERTAIRGASPDVKDLGNVTFTGDLSGQFADSTLSVVKGTVTMGEKSSSGRNPRLRIMQDPQLLGAATYGLELYELNGDGRGGIAMHQTATDQVRDWFFITLNDSNAPFGTLTKTGLTVRTDGTMRSPNAFFLGEGIPTGNYTYWSNDLATGNSTFNNSNYPVMVFNGSSHYVGLAGRTQPLVALDVYGGIYGGFNSEFAVSTAGVITSPTITALFAGQTVATNAVAGTNGTAANLTVTANASTAVALNVTNAIGNTNDTARLLGTNTGTGLKIEANGSATLNGNLTFTDNLYDIGASGANRPRNIHVVDGVNLGGSIGLAASSSITWPARVQMNTPADGKLTLIANGAGSGWSLLQLGGTTATYPAVKRVGAGLEIVGADGVSSSTNNLVASGSITATNGFAGFSTNIVPSVNAAGYTNSTAAPGTGTGIAMIANVSGTSGTYVYYHRSGAIGATVCGTALYTNTIIASGDQVPVGVNCGIQIVSGIGVVIQAYPFP